MKTVTYRLIAMIFLIVLIGVLGSLIRQFGSLDWIISNENRMRDYVQQQPWLGWFLGLAIYVAFSLIPGFVGKSVVVGWIFGFWQAVLLVDVGLTIAAVSGFLASRFFFRDIVQTRFKGLVAKLDHRLEKECAFYLIMLRVAHVPFSLVNYCVGATSVPLRTFGWTTAIGILPGSMVFAFVGSRIPTLAKIVETGVWQLLDPMLFAILAAAFAFPVIIRWAIRRYQAHAGTDPTLELTELAASDSWSVKRQANGAD